MLKPLIHRYDQLNSLSNARVLTVDGDNSGKPIEVDTQSQHGQQLLTLINVLKDKVKQDIKTEVQGWG